MKDTNFNTFKSLNIKGRLWQPHRPQIMGILNVTPDSFFDGGKYLEKEKYLHQAEKMLEEGASILDIGGYSTRPGAKEVSEAEEIDRVMPVISNLAESFPDSIISIDTFRAGVAEQAIKAGAAIINDISGGSFDENMFSTAGKLNVPYILMHIQGTPETMQKNPTYENVVDEVMLYFSKKINELRSLGVNDIIIDPGFGFGKNQEHNFELMRQLRLFRIFGCKIMVGISRKSMVNKTLKIKSKDALNGTTALHMLALQNSADILRVHDVLAAREAIDIWMEYLMENMN